MDSSASKCPLDPGPGVDRDEVAALTIECGATGGNRTRISRVALLGPTVGRQLQVVSLVIFREEKRSWARPRRALQGGVLSD